MRILVTGGAGFVGGHLVALLVGEGHEVAVVDRLLASHPSWARLPDGAVRLEGDLTDPDVAREAVRGVDAVSHQAARVGLGVSFDDVVDYVSDNDLATASLLRALWSERFTGRLVVASSMVVYGEGAYTCPVHGPVRPAARRPDDLGAGRFDPPCPRCGAPLSPGLIGEDAPLDPRNTYAATKVHTEHLAACFGRESGSPTIALRYHNVYGPYMPRDTPYAGVASIFRSALARGEAPSVHEDGGQRRDFVHVGDVARANLAALVAAPDVEGPFNVASGEVRSVLDLATTLADELGGPAPVVTGAWRTGDVRHVTASPARAERVLGLATEVSFDEGVRELARAPQRES
jgi:dTDP-L-rhamnose 4-epimerase